MNTNHIKSYAPKARSAFIAAMTKQAAKYGITAKSSEPLEQKGDLALIGDRAFPASIIRPRAALVQKVAQLGFAQAMEQAAYSWFNRLCAIRFMELKGYLDHGLRVLSHPSQAGGFQILDDCLNIELPGLDKQRITELKLDGNQDEALYRELLLTQCHALHQAMPFLFEAIDDQTELLLPDNLTKTDSLIRELVDAIPEEDWQDVEIIGWLYQFYISEKKDQVIGKVVKSEDIPAATQLFTPNWIVKYMVQNSLGAQWLATYPQSPLKGQMEYYIEPAEQTDEVNAQLAAITPSQLNPEELTLIDPASGSGHILVEAYDLFKAIYLERGYRQRDIPQLILEKNLFGLDIDKRAAQLSGFALMMKGREDDRRLFERGVKLNVMALVDSAGFDAEVLASGITLSDYGLQLGDLNELKLLFEHATTFGSLIQVPEELAKKVSGLKQLREASSQDLFVADELKRLGPLVRQAELLAAQYDAVVANPPYMGSKFHAPALKKFAKQYFLDSKSDLFTCFMERSYTLARDAGRTSMVTMQSWMFLSSFQKMRERLIREKSIMTMAQIGYNSFPTLNSKVAQATVFSLINGRIKSIVGSFVDLNSAPQSADKEAVFLSRGIPICYEVSVDDFGRVPGSPVAYWVSETVRSAFERGQPFSQVGSPKVGMQTANNDKYLRLWYEINYREFTEARPTSPKWIKYLKGGPFRRWFGNMDYLLRYNGDPGFLRQEKNATTLPETKLLEAKCTWTDVTTGPFNARYAPADTFHDISGHCFYPTKELQFFLLAFTNTNVFNSFLALVNSSFHFQVGDVGKMPVLDEIPEATRIGRDLVQEFKADWNAFERAWDFQSLPILKVSTYPAPGVRLVVASVDLSKR